MGTLQRIALGLVIIGALNWGLIGLFQFDLVATLFGGQGAFWSRVVYGLVGLSGLICLGLLFKPEERREERIEVHREPRFTNPNLHTEFGEEHDLTRRRNPDVDQED
ncbi:sporulation protein yuza [Bacillus sp. OxB-1]|uniref:DUF378 domain-containing protein n=1 Tax=Bacillus sp. (strain OxB-1) TaxID=98228 RepID=UPI0005822A3D|nr:DUF378 domain-containing protein [Bacillus sp. OxB-1]BAQ10635.1 sporulation protein yuza [Bacillus sp. OxB-1]